MMENDGNNVEEVEGELTSTTMGNILSASSVENANKDETNDLTPSSSTDASTTTSISHVAMEDPISSTSETPIPAEGVEATTSKMDTTSIVSEKDLIAMNITDTSVEKITENVDDIVQDLENLLGEPAISFTFNPKPIKITELELVEPKQAEISTAEVEKQPEEVKDIVESLDTSKEEIQEPEEIPTVSAEIQQEIIETECECPEIKTSDDVTSSNDAVAALVEPEEPENTLDSLETVKIGTEPEINPEIVETLPEAPVKEGGDVPEGVESPEPININEVIPQSGEEKIKISEIIKDNEDKPQEGIMLIENDSQEKRDSSPERSESPEETTENEEIESQPIVEQIPSPDKDEIIEPETPQLEDPPIKTDEVELEETPMEIEQVEPEETTMDVQEVEAENKDEIPVVEVPEVSKSPIFIEPEEAPMEVGETETESEEKCSTLEVPEGPESPIPAESISEEKLEPEESSQSPKNEEPEEPSKSGLRIPSEDETVDAISSIQLIQEEIAESPSPEQVLQPDLGERESEILPIKEIEPEVLPVEEIEAEAEASEEKEPEVIPIEENVPEILPTEELEPDVSPTEHKEREILPTEQVEPDIVPTEEIEPEILPIEEIESEAKTPEEKQPEVIPTETKEPEILPTEEIKSESDSLEEKEPEVIPIDEKEPEILPIEEIEPEAKTPEEKEPEVIPTEKKEPEIEPIEEIESESDSSEEKEPEVIPIEEKEPEILPTEEIEPVTLPFEEIESEADSPDEKEHEVILTEENEPEILPTEEIDPEVVSIEEKEPEMFPAEKIEPEVVPIEENEPEIRPTEEIEPEVLPTEENEPDVLPVEEIEQEILSTEKKESDVIPCDEMEREVTPTEEDDSEVEATEVTHKLQEPLLINIDENSEKEKYYSPKITIKPIIKSPSDEDEEYQPDEKESTKGSLKMTITKQDNIMHSILKIYDPVEDSGAQEGTVPKLIIKPIPQEQLHSPKSSRSSKSYSPNQKSSSPRITIKPIVKPPEESQGVVSPLKITLKSPKLTIKPILKPLDDGETCEVKTHSPRITIKPIVKPQSECGEVSSTPKITIKPVIKPPEESNDDDSNEAVEIEETKQRIVLKINKGSLQESRKRERCGDDDDKNERLAKIKVKISKEGHPHIVHQEPSHSSKLEEILMTETRNNEDLQMLDDMPSHSLPSPIIISEDSTMDDVEDVSSKDPLGDIPSFPIEPPLEIVEVVAPPAPTPRKRGRPRKVPLEVREDFKEEPKPVVVYESTRPKRSCRGPSVRTTLGIKPRKPRGGGRGRGSKRGMGTRGAAIIEEPIQKPATRGRPSLKDDLSSVFRSSQKSDDDGFSKTPVINVIEPPSAPSTSSSQQVADIVMYEEETRMSAETSGSRAQTPAKQVVTTIEIDESQSSVLSSATTESVKGRKGSRLEVQEPEGAVIAADQLAEYYWSGGGPYMLQEQVAQFLGIKSFKRKYPNIARRFVDMQERDFIRESGLAGESMCDLGLTAVNSADILDIMYSDFQDKYEEYCKHQRDRQAKDLTNKQKALTLAASQEKTKLDITQQAVQSAASWNTTFNKARRCQRKACMDLQTLTIHYPKGKMKQINRPKLGHYPVALVPGQFTDYYKEFSPTEINNLPLNTICYNHIAKVVEMDYCDSQTDGSGSESDSSSSDSDSSFSGSSDGENCTLCKPSTPGKRLAV